MERTDLLMLLLQQQGLSQSDCSSISRTSRSACIPLSFAQERLWFVDQLGLVGSAYNIPLVLRLEGELDVGSLQRAFSELVQRHEVLRTHFEAREGVAYQIIDSVADFAIEMAELPQDGATSAEQWLKELMQRERLRRFDLSHSPLIRVVLGKLSAKEHVLLLTIHHIVSDGWSMGVLVRELSALYAAYVQGAASPLVPLPIQYADYALWQRQWLQGEVLEKQLKYWRERLQGAPPVLKLPTDRARPAVASFKGGVLSFVLPAPLSSALSELSRREGVTLYMLLLSAFQLLLSRLSGQKDIVVGSPIAGRTHRQTEELIGLFVNMLVLRTDLSGNPSFRALLGRVKEVTLGAYAHQELPFEKLVAELQPERSLSHQPIFQAVLELQNVCERAITSPVLRSREILTHQATMAAQFDLSLHVLVDSKNLLGFLEYATDLYNETTIERLAGHFRRLLEGVVANPEIRIDELSLLDESQRDQLLVQWNRTSTQYPRQQCIHELFHDQASRTPDAIALVCGQERLSYRQLDVRSNQLGHYLRQRGVGPEVRVGLCMERSVQMVVGLLGILKAGGAYVPLDSSYPVQRLSYVLADAQVSIVLTGERHESIFGAAPVQLVKVDKDQDAIARQSEAVPPSGVCAQNLAYVLYTSGSTGKPKGVSTSHAAVVNYLHFAADAYRIPSTSGAAALATSIAFDGSVPALYVPLLHGWELWLLPQSEEIQALATLLEHDTDCRLIKLAPAHLQALVGLSSARVDKSERIVVVGGEILETELVARWSSRFSRDRLFNQYGPTETTVACTAYSVDTQLPKARTIPIGRPIPNVRLYVLDDYLEPVPQGVSGELYIAGEGLARGYLHRASLTAERFIANPFEQGERMYRSGDRVRYLDDGNLEFIGRVDEQVKVRGYRIEPGEIESVLLQHAAVRQAVVLVREDEPAEKQLVAYVVGEALDQAELREHLKSRLPEYMLPNAWVMLPELPVTSNGKLDRSRLPAPQGRPEVGQYVAPRTPIEESVAGIWTEVLRIERAGLHDNFFELGGHSLLATRVVSRIREVLHIELPLRTFFEAPVLEQFCKQVALEDTKSLERQQALDGIHESLRKSVEAMSDEEVQAQLARRKAAVAAHL